nr:hypothetical protein [Tanacetum cinerariifolium]
MKEGCIKDRCRKQCKVDLGKALDVGFVIIKSSRTKSRKQDTSSWSGNDADADNSYIKSVDDEEPMAEVQLTTERNVFATGNQHVEKP